LPIVVGLLVAFLESHFTAASDDPSMKIAKQAAASQAIKQETKSDDYEDIRNVVRFVAKKFGVKAPKIDDLNEEAFVLGRKYISHYRKLKGGLDEVVKKVVGGPYGLQSKEKQSEHDFEKSVDTTIIGMEVLDYVQNKLDFDLEDLGDTEEMAHVKELQMRAEKYLKLVLRVWRYGLKSSRGREDERDWKNLVFCLKYTIYILTLDLGKLVGVTDTYEKLRVPLDRHAEYLPKMIARNINGDLMLVGEDEFEEVLSKEEVDKFVTDHQESITKNKTIANTTKWQDEL